MSELKNVYDIYNLLSQFEHFTGVTESFLSENNEWDFKILDISCNYIENEIKMTAFLIENDPSSIIKRVKNVKVKKG